MLNLIRARNSVFRTNSGILCRYAELRKKSFCTSSQNKNKKNEDDDDDNSDTGKKSNNGKPFLLKKSKVNIQKIREKRGLLALHELLEDATKSSTDKNVDVKEEEIKDLHPDSESTANHEILSNLKEYAVEKPTTKKVELTTAKEKVTKLSSKKELLDKVRAAAVELGGDVESTTNDLLTAYKFVEERPEKVHRVSKTRKKFTDGVRSFREKDVVYESENVFKIRSLSSTEKLEIFTENVRDQPDEPLLKMWHRLHAESLINSTVHAPKNYFEQLILWTQHGKLWHFPIDNEQGMELEKKIDFTEHIFLDQYLEPWCPKAGPLRHFMELVTVGLSKNPYITVQQKKDHIMWYKQYFEDKKKLLSELGMLEPASVPKIESA